MEKYNKYILILIAVIVIGMSIGYSVLESSLRISGEVNYRPQDDIRITSFTTDSKPDEMTIQYSDYSKHEVKLGYTTTGACSITYTVEVKNISGVNMGILSIDGLDSNVKVQENIVGTKLVGPAETKTFTITFSPTKDETKTYLLTFDFEQVFTITYNGFSNTDNYKKEILEGDDYTQNFGSNAPTKLEITMGGVAVENYTYSNGTLTIPNVNGNIEITAPNVCDFPSYTDSSGANAPVLNGDMIPVVYSEECQSWIKQDLDKSYDYSKQIWANAVTIVSEKRNEIKNASVGTPISMEDINTMWVWIPRYSYTIKSEDGTNYYGKASFGNNVPSGELPGEIDVKFISKNAESEKGIAQYISNEASGWYTNEAFDFPETDKEGNNTPTKRGGIWVGKFETTGSLEKSSQACSDISCDVSNVTIKPGNVSIRNQTVSSFFYMARSMQLNNASTFGFSESGDLHMMKNDEWGAVAYLSQSKYGKYGNNDYASKNKEIYINNNREYITGQSGGNTTAGHFEKSYEYNDMTNLGDGQGQAGPGASTTGNVYGIYDINGGSWEYVMGVLEYDIQGIDANNGQVLSANSGFKGLNYNGSKIGSIELPNIKYYNKYKSADSSSSTWSSVKPESACNGGVCYGQALSEIRASNVWNGWYNDSTNFISRDTPWFRRGGSCSKGSDAGAYYSEGYYGDTHEYLTTRLVLTP